jgi:hypothetical protein
LVRARLDAGIEPGYWAGDCGEPSRHFDLESGHFLPHYCYSSEDVAGHEVQRELVRVVDQDSLVDLQTQGFGE